MAKLDIVEGVGDDKFEPNREITRAEFTAMAMRFAQGRPAGRTSSPTWTRTTGSTTWLSTPSNMGGSRATRTGPSGPRTSSLVREVTTIVNRMLGRLPDESSSTPTRTTGPVPDVIKNWAYYDVVEATNDHQYKKTSSGEDWTKLG